MKLVTAEQFSTRRDAADYGDPETREAVKRIVERVRREGDAALREFTERFDGVRIDDWRVPEAEVVEAYARVSPEFLAALRRAADNIRAFHERQRRGSWFEARPDGSVVGQLVRPLSRIGVYVPGGKAAYPSSVLMNVIPARVAGVPEIVMATPARTAGGPGGSGVDPHVLVAAAEAGVREIYRIGGAQAIAALAYGTESIRRVDKIVGPGNLYVALAKRFVFGDVDVDQIAGPSEIAVLADESADPAWIAADLLSQAEHDEAAMPVLITPSERLARAVSAEIERRLASLPRRPIAERSVREQGVIVLVRDLDEGVDVLNRLAPEHAELLVADPWTWLGRIENAGAVFLGPYSPEPVGDYYAGPNHVLPTGGTARFSSPLGVDDFLKKTSVVFYGAAALRACAGDVAVLARTEGLEAHALAVETRFAAGDKGRSGGR
ncbi:MAG: histidinol dehydrogenase [Candidatus Reconcilbacillus cellulovorans]|uniref:Histidinol dehydrogenase n=1 Tax=Candidatus Reconcilbacillus cellulovorans TaxID=1906605 RepID=A0A2A6E2I9_9BACL|nr:MAG: histidinol dehydrogenase [Candidatus Reconcilbacillus cellulovorans]